MKRQNLVLCFFFSLVLILPAQDNLPPRQKEWLELVKPIITKIEREIFEQLSTNIDRDKFIQTFWKRRDTKPDTEANEFYAEYMERVRFADKFFGFEASGKGSQSERGFFYLLLGPPLERQVYATQSELWPLELWYYQGDADLGLPPYFYLIFYQDKGIGRYRLYSPGMDGPEKLVVPSMAGNVVNRNSAHKMVKDISGE
ncbi:MAG: GWxTD domain-containing protein, partial [Candidatus Aminicenantes bacterium]|nr:GWxTD domain-containing protein [Candidatus Aminicenantes bacterium]